MIRNACHKDGSRGGIKQCTSGKHSDGLPPPPINSPKFTGQCSVDIVKLSPVSFPSTDVVVRLSIAREIVKVPLRARGTGFGVAPRTPKTAVITQMQMRLDWKPKRRAGGCKAWPRSRKWWNGQPQAELIARRMPHLNPRGSEWPRNFGSRGRSEFQAEDEGRIFGDRRLGCRFNSDKTEAEEDGGGEGRRVTPTQQGGASQMDDPGWK